MDLPFSLTDFLNVFKDYNQSVFPLQIIFYLIAFLCIYLLFTENKNATRIISIALSFFWLWMGIVCPAGDFVCRVQIDKEKVFIRQRIVSI